MNLEKALMASISQIAQVLARRKRSMMVCTE